MALTIQDIQTLFERKGGEQYSGEPVTQLQHALQCAQLAESEGADDGLITASLLHDLGHLLHELGDTPTLRGVDDVHQYIALPFLRGLFPEAVLNPIKLHVDAKRYLCATRAGYWAALSEDSKRSLVLQGGVFDAGQLKAFEAVPHALDAVRLRLWDDQAKRAHHGTPPLSHYLHIAAACALSQ